MPGYPSWIGQRGALRLWRTDNNPRTAGVANMITDKPAVIVVIRQGVALTAQTVRVDVFGSTSSERMDMGNNALVNTQRVLVLGYRNHPTIADTDLQANDKFVFDNQSYRVVRVESAFTDRVEALAEATE